jgi:hypothetical protein
MDTVELNRHIEAHNQNLYAFVPFHGIPLRGVCEDLKLLTPDTITRACTDKPMLDQKGFPADQVEGLQKCFVFYVKMPKSRWKDIRRAEANTVEGQKVFLELKEEYSEKYLPSGENLTKSEKYLPSGENLTKNELHNVADLEYALEYAT